MVVRQENSNNAFDLLGGEKKDKVTGKHKTVDNVNLKPTVPAELHHFDDDLNMLVRRNHDDFPEYIKHATTGTTFKRTIDTTGKSPLKIRQETIYEGKQSAVHMASLMKSNGNGKFIRK